MGEEKDETQMAPLFEAALRDALSKAGVDEKTPTPVEETVLLGRLAYLLEDPHIYSLIDREYPEYTPVKLILSGLARTTNLDPIRAAVVKYRAFTAADLTKLTKPKDKITWKELAFVEALKAHIETAVADTIEGWRGKLITEQVKSYRVEPAGEERERKRWWERLFGR